MEEMTSRVIPKDSSEEALQEGLSPAKSTATQTLVPESPGSIPRSQTLFSLPALFPSRIRGSFTLNPRLNVSRIPE